MRVRLGSRSREKGSSLVETALTLTIFFALLLGITQLAMVVYYYHTINEVARETTRWAAVRGSGSCLTPQKVTDCNANATTIKSHVAGLNVAGITASDVTVAWCNPPVGGTVDNTCSQANAPGNLVKITVTSSKPLVLPMIHTFPLSMTSTSKMLIAQ
jgi:Flp pilus assembly protein TadG